MDLNCLSKKELIELVKYLLRKVSSLENRLKALESKLSKDSHNSDKPPSSDGLKRNKPNPKSLREKSNKKSGGQKNHKGHTLEMKSEPDQIEKHHVSHCNQCDYSLKNEKVLSYSKRQVFDIPKPELKVTEHQADIIICPKCGKENIAAFPEGVTQKVQYGKVIKELSIYLMNYQLLPYQRTREYFRDIYMHPLSEGTLYNNNKKFSKILEPVDIEIKNQLIGSYLAHFDETGIHCKGALHWLHVTSTNKLTYYKLHKNRGQKAMDDIGILPKFKGHAMHDFLPAYNKYECNHSFCNSHILRELIYLYEIENQKWADKLIKCILQIKNTVEQQKEKSDHLEKPVIIKFENKYKRILREGFLVNPIVNPKVNVNARKRKGRKKLTKPQNLLNRLRDYQKEILTFMYDFKIPFDNNLAERDIRMNKVKQKISGCFRSDEGAEYFYRIRGYISTARKNGVNALKAIDRAFSGNPFIPVPDD